MEEKDLASALKKQPKYKDKSVDDMSREEMIEKIRQMESHIFQLKNIISRNDEAGMPKTKQNKQRAFDFNRYNTRHVALKVAYLGWDYQGFAVQEDTDKTIETALFKALHRTKLIESRETSNYHRCGRTDKGVSAFGQVISIDLRTNLLEGMGVKNREGGSANERSGEKTTEIPFPKILNKVLPQEIRILAWTPVNTDFSARFSCLKRTYKYFFPKGNLNLEKMRAAAERLHGEHDYRNFCKMDVANGVVNYKRNIQYTDIVCGDDPSSSYSMCVLTVIGQAFLWHQIRCIVALLFMIGQEKETPEIIDELLNIEANPRKPQYTMAAELPLCLYDCEFVDLNWLYDDDWFEETIKSLQEQWTSHTIRSEMVMSMLNSLNAAHHEKKQNSSGDEKPCAVVMQYQADCLLPGNKPRTYIPLLNRQKCESLDEKIKHCAKRRKIELEEK